MRKKILILNEEIYKLREQGFTYQKITQYFNNKGIKVSSETIRKRCKKIYQEKGKREPDLKVGRKKVIQIPDEEIYKLREQGLSYEKIVQYFNNKGIKVSSATIRKRCKNIYQEKGKKEPKACINLPDEEIYKLREQGFTYQKITQYFNNKGIKVKIGIIRKRCKKIYQEKGKREPDLKVGRKKVIQMQDEEIYQLRQDGLSYRKITQYFNNKGIKVSSETIRNRCKNIYQKKIEEKPDLKVGRKKVIQIPDEEIYKLREQGLSYEKIAQYFYKKGMKVSFATIRIRCKRMYQEKASDYKNKKSDKTSLADLEKKLQELKEKKEKSGELLEEYVELKEKYEQLRKQQGKKEEEK